MFMDSKGRALYAKPEMISSVYAASLDIDTAWPRSWAFNYSIKGLCYESSEFDRETSAEAERTRMILWTESTK